MQKKRLAVILYHTCPLSDEIDAEIGGANTYVLELSKAMARKGFELDVFTRLQDAKSARIVQVLPTMRVIHLPAGKAEKIDKKQQEQFIPEFLRNFYAFAKKEDIQYSFVSAHYYLSGIIAKDIKEQFGIPMIMTFHTLGLMKNLVARSEEERESLQRIKTEMNLVQVADQIIATSSADAKYIETLYSADAKKIAVLIPGVNLSLFTPGDKEKAKVQIGAEEKHKIILFVGRIEPLKGIDVLLYAMKILLKKHPQENLCVWIVGGDVSKAADQWSRELRKLDDLRKVLDINTAVKFVGRKTPEELPNYYRAAEFLVLPSHYESFGITAVEAMACGVPVIATDTAGVSDLIDTKHAQLITSANNPILLAKKMYGLLDDVATRQHLSQDIVESISDLSWDSAAEAFKKLCIGCVK